MLRQRLVRRHHLVSPTVGEPDEDVQMVSRAAFCHPGADENVACLGNTRGRRDEQLVGGSVLARLDRDSL
ncbi:MAG: hypothetical protein AB7J32_25915 [Pseudonocardia sp.]